VLYCTKLIDRAQKSLDFQGPPLPMALEMDFPTSIVGMQ
jgi:hypothetical protein